MTNIPPFYRANVGGIARVEAVAVKVEADRVTYTFRSHPWIRGNYNGLVIIRLLDLPDGIPIIPVFFNSGDGDVAPTKVGGSQLQSSDIVGDGVFLFYYDSALKQLQVITGIV